MCVIVLCKEKFPGKEVMELCDKANPHLAGVAWPDGKGYVQFAKGLTLGELERVLKRAKLPCVIHFRQSTVGGISEKLAHPFIVSKTSPLALEGRTREKVLFHNGHWSSWKELCLKTLHNNPAEKFPGGPWSDSRAMAWLVYHYGTGYLSLLNEKVAIVSPRGITLYGGLFTEEDGITYSNLYWKLVTSRAFTQPMVPYQKTKEANYEVGKELFPYNLSSSNTL